MFASLRKTSYSYKPISVRILCKSLVYYSPISKYVAFREFRPFVLYFNYRTQYKGWAAYFYIGSRRFFVGRLQLSAQHRKHKFCLTQLNAVTIMESRSAFAQLSVDAIPPKNKKQHIKVYNCNKLAILYHTTEDHVKKYRN